MIDTMKPQAGRHNKKFKLETLMIYEKLVRQVPS